MTIARRMGLFVAAVLVGIAVGCRSQEIAHSWGYHGPAGPTNWGSLAPNFSVARTGTEQSPIDIVRGQVARAPLPQLRFAYANAASLAVAHNGHTVQADLSDGASAITVGSGTYDVVQFHFHVPSEHTVDGKHYPAELHLVHRAASGALAVVGVFLAEGETHAQLAKLYTNGELATPASPKRTVDSFDLGSLLPRSRASYRYPGSLTTPPCTEGVSWIVLAQPITADTEQLAALARRFSGEAFPHGNRRPTQPLGARAVQTEDE